eukprot:CAMPEP_0114267322 /NCGR_PEP_ID=MMETSP0058-20121206/25204_1 /TAXON_ID=36894 /ORGANISM="Pyramimonas parkeae, CCMP726" /LENGTH=45 /DNA_ID= /DNA_START= /DNA_END= /DNA_ORIENTATION=
MTSFATTGSVTNTTSCPANRRPATPPYFDEISIENFTGSPTISSA